MTTSYQIETAVITSARQDHITDVRRSVQVLKALRSNFELGHEVGHVTLTFHVPNRTGMAATSNALQLFNSMHLTPIADWPTIPAIEVIQSISTPEIPRLSLPSEHLQSWQIQAAYMFAWHEFVRLDLDDSLDRGRTSGRMRVLFREGALIADNWLTSLRILDSMLRVFCCTVALRVVSRQRLNIRVYVLVLIAVCQRYGHREDPADHHFLPERHHPTFRGAACAVI
jgi:hypothetical protein